MIASRHPLDELRRMFGDRFAISQEHRDRGGHDVRYVAVARHLRHRPYCVISGDPAEVAAALAGGTG